MHPETAEQNGKQSCHATALAGGTLVESIVAGIVIVGAIGLVVAAIGSLLVETVAAGSGLLATLGVGGVSGSSGKITVAIHAMCGMVVEHCATVGAYFHFDKFKSSVFNFL